MYKVSPHLFRDDPNNDYYQEKIQVEVGPNQAYSYPQQITNELINLKYNIENITKKAEAIFLLAIAIAAFLVIKQIFH